MRDPIEIAWTLGFEAGNRLLPSGSNPFKIGSSRHEAWFDGWCNGSDPDLEGVHRSKASA